VERNDRAGWPNQVIWPLTELPDDQVVGFEDPGDCLGRLGWCAVTGYGAGLVFAADQNVEPGLSGLRNRTSPR
jgi:hypothetical protein